MKRLSLVAIVLAGCATTASESNVAPSPSAAASASAAAEGAWLPMLSVPTRGSPASVIDRARARLDAFGFGTHLAGLNGEAPALDELLVTDDPREPGRCFGTTEVISVRAVTGAAGTTLNFACVTASWSESAKGGACDHSHVPGCPHGGDRALAEVVSDAVSSL